MVWIIQDWLIEKAANSLIRLINFSIRMLPYFLQKVEKMPNYPILLNGTNFFAVGLCGLLWSGWLFKADLKNKEHDGKRLSVKRERQGRHVSKEGHKTQHSSCQGNQPNILRIYKKASRFDCEANTQHSVMQSSVWMII